MDILIYGFGRMGLTHFTILNGLNPQFNFTVVEPNKFLCSLLKTNFDKVTFHKDDSSITKAFDITLITTPPFIHLELLKKSINRGDKKIFIEKPFGGYTNVINDPIYNSKNIFIGYVLRYNPCIQWAKSNISTKDIHSIKGQFLSNTLEKKPVGWRNGPFSGVLNEVGSHVIDLIQYILGNRSMDVHSASKQSIVSDVDDILDAQLKTETNVSVYLHFNWVKKEIRKPVFSLEILMKDGTKYFLDQQQVFIYNDMGNIINKISVTDISETVPFYLRGIDFTKQMEDLLDDCSVMADVNDALEVNKILKKILNHEDNSR